MNCVRYSNAIKRNTWTQCHTDILALYRLNKYLKKIGWEPIIGISKAKIGKTLRNVENGIQRHVSGRTDTTIFLVKYLKPCIPSGKPVNDASGTIGRAIINHETLPILICLIKNGLQAFCNIFFHVINGNDNCDFRYHSFLPRRCLGK